MLIETDAPIEPLAVARLLKTVMASEEPGLVADIFEALPELEKAL